MSEVEFDRRKFQKKLGKQIAKIRKAKGYSQGRLELESGLTRGVLNPIERGIYDPKASTLYKIADVLGVRINKFFEFDR